MKHFQLLVAIVLLALVTACTEQKAQQVDSETEVVETVHITPILKDLESEGILKHYLLLKSELIKSNGVQAQKYADTLKTAFTAAKNEKAFSITQKIAGSDNVKNQRSFFNQLTAEVEAIVRAKGLKSGTIYKQYCPMANNGDGAYWLSAEAEVKNPYYGDEMLSCGEVKEEIK